MYPKSPGTALLNSADEHHFALKKDTSYSHVNLCDQYLEHTVAVSPAQTTILAAELPRNEVDSPENVKKRLKLEAQCFEHK